MWGKRPGLALAAALFGVLSVGCGSNEPPSSSQGETQSAAEEASSSPTIITLEPSPQPTAESPELYSMDAPELPDGDDGRVAIVATGDYERFVGSLPVIVRNNTADDVSRVSVTAEVRDASGNLVAAGESQGLIPNVIEPGELAIGYVYFSDAHVPPDAEIALEATSDESLAEFENIVGLPIKEANDTPNSIVGLIENNYDIRVSGPIDVEVVCFSADGQLTDQFSDFAPKDALGPGETSPFQIDVFDGKCERFLAGAAGFTE